MSYAAKIKSKAEHLGKLHFSKDVIKFTTHNIKSSGQINRKYFHALGDVVYFFFINDKLMKIGKAAGAVGWYSRMGEYTKKRYGKSGKEYWDATTRKIYNFMIDHGYQNLDVYAIQSLRISRAVVSPISGKTRLVEIETAKDLEQMLIQEAMNAGEDLPFCREILK